jgi:hypothetical protein
MKTNHNGKDVGSKRPVAKSYPEQLAEWVNQPTRKLRDRHLVTFMAVRNDVEAALQAGFAAKTIWTNMHEAGRVDFCYETFLKHVKRCINTPLANPAAHTVKAKSKTAAGPVIVAPPAMQGFVFNPVPNKEELL